MEYYKHFIGKANLMKVVCAIILIVLIGRFFLCIGMTAYEMSPKAIDDAHIVTTEGNNSTKFVNSEFSGLGYIQLTRNIISTKTEFPKSLPLTFAGIYFISALMLLPLILIFWWSYSIFKELAIGRTPFVASIYSKVKKIGILVIVFGASFPFVYSLLLQIFVVGFSGLSNPINFYMVLIGIIILIISEVLEYGQRLQLEVDETL